MEPLSNIRNFCVISHVDHGKSTLADRFLELTGTVEKRRMKEQFLDQMELERERGITIKMTPVRMNYTLHSTFYTLNLIDTPGHVDFSYEVSRALKAVEGAILLVDASQGVQAQTLSVLAMAQEAGLAIIPAVNKIDLPVARVAETKEEIVKLLGCREDEILEVSGKTGQGVPELLEAIIRRVLAPRTTTPDVKVAPTSGVGNPVLRALVFDFAYSAHQGITLYVRVFDGSVKKGDHLKFVVAGHDFTAGTVGIFAPQELAQESLAAGQIGFIVTGIKEAGVVSVGDTITRKDKPFPALAGYREPKPMVWASIYPENQKDFLALKKGLERLHLSDASLSFEEETSSVLGRGFRAGFLGLLHLEIATERLRREFGLNLIITTPTIGFQVKYRNGHSEIIRSAALFPDDGSATEVLEPIAEARIITPPEHLGLISQLLHEHEAVLLETKNFGTGRLEMSAKMPLRELMRGFFDELKSATSGFGSLSYKLLSNEPADVARLDVLIADEVVPAFSRIVPRRRIESEAKAVVEKIHKLLPRQLFEVKIQARAGGRIIASRRLSALRKDVTGYLYGGDITRKRKLWEKQKRGKKKLAERGRVNIPAEVYLKLYK